MPLQYAVETAQLPIRVNELRVCTLIKRQEGADVKQPQTDPKMSEHTNRALARLYIVEIVDSDR